MDVYFKGSSSRCCGDSRRFRQFSEKREAFRDSERQAGWKPEAVEPLEEVKSFVTEAAFLMEEEDRLVQKYSLEYCLEAANYQSAVEVISLRVECCWAEEEDLI